MIMVWTDREGWLNFMYFGDGRVEHKKERDQWRWGKSSWETGTWIILCASQLIIPDTTGTSPDPAGNNTDSRSSNPIRQVVLLICHSRSYPPYRSQLHPPSLSFSSITRPSSQEHKVKSSLSISPCHHNELTRSASYTECSIHRVQHSPKIVCHAFILTISSWPLNVASASGVPPYRSTATSQFSIRASKVKSPHHIPTVSS